MLFPLNSKLCSEMEKVMGSWTTEECFGPIFVRFAPFLKMYTEYANKYSAQMAALAKVVDVRFCPSAWFI